MVSSSLSVVTHPHSFVAGVRVELEPVLEPGNVRPGHAPGHAHETDLAAQVVAQDEVGALDDARARVVEVVLVGGGEVEVEHPRRE